MIPLAAFLRFQQAVVLMVVWGVMAGSAWAQATDGGPTPGTASLDKRLLDSIYQIQTPAFRRTMRAVDATAYPVFVGAPVSAWLGVWAVRGGGDWSDAYRLTLSGVGALTATAGLKYLTRRTRPYVRYPDVDSRTGDIARWDPYSFPSGHAAIAFALATSWTLSHPRWYVAAPGYVWAVSVALSRVWLGVHYPSDVVFGALLGSALAWGLHRLGDAVTPAFLRDEDAPPALPMLRLRVPLP